ncbi:hypothetical protein EZS27_025409 [termite gut metagenome]|uniref:Uncharacterized protein n=1 Tax=termite gut metagenome TaxID=433724 RepID=A0A5J4QY08_9ZZZZ
MKQMKYILSLLLVTLALTACNTYSEDFDIEYSSIHPMGGMYRINITDETGATTLSNNFCYLANTVDNSVTQAWIRIGAYNANPASGWAINGKISVDLNILSFSGSGIENLAGNVTSSSNTFSVTDGQVKLKGATAPSGTTSDAISFTFTNSRFPGKTYKAEGYRYTGWEGD